MPSSVRDVFTGVAGSWLDLSTASSPTIHASGDPADVDLYRLIGPAAVLDLSGRAGSGVPVQVTDLQVWEARHGTLPDRVLLVVRAGGEGGARVPGLAVDAARWLVEERSPGAVLLDGAVDEAGDAMAVLLEAGVPVVEEVGGVDGLPEWGAFVVALPPPVGTGDGADRPTRSLRVVAFLPDAARVP